MTIRRADLIVAGVLFLAFPTGCARETRTVRIETSMVSPAPAAERPSAPPVAEPRTTTTRTQEASRSRGVLSATVHVIGKILALPFRLVGGLLEILF